MIQKFKSLSPINKIIISCAPILYISIFLILYFTLGKQLTVIISDKGSMKEWISSFGIYDEAVFVLIRALQTVIKIIPAEPLEIGAGYIWGTYKGLVLCMLGTEIGSAIILILTSVFGTKLLNMLFDLEQIKKWSFISNVKRKYLFLTVLYLVPGTPKDFITYFVGVTDTKILPFLIITGIARIPSVITSTWCGEILDRGSLKSFIIAFSAITVISLALGYLVQKKLKKRID